MAASLVSTFTLPYAVQIFARCEVLIRESVNLNIQISFYRDLKMKWLVQAFQIDLRKK